MLPAIVQSLGSLCQVAGDQFERGSMEQDFSDVIIDRNTVQKLSGHTSYYTHSPECRRTTMMHVVASSDPRIFTFSVKKI